jgi:Zn-dependent protease with chaperone function
LLPNSPSLVALIALVPGIVVWWTGRRIATRTSDPALPELLWAHRHRTRNVFLTSFFLAVFIGGRHAFWGIPLMAIVTTMGGYSLHRALGIDSASLPRQLRRDAKSIAGGLGFWIALTLIPTIVLSIDPRYRMLGLLLIPILLAWEHWYQQIWLRAHDAELVTEDALVSRFRAIDARAGIASPKVYRVGGPDARFMNALAFPAIRGPSIGLGNALVELLEPDEVAAIYAHELSHIEEFSPRKIRRHQLVTRSLIVGGVLLSLGVAFAAPGTAWVLPWVWPVLALSAIALRGKGSKNRETESDLRAAALCGDAEVMIRALIKVHVHGFIPRRWDVDFERHASHPSLTRRIQALRGEAAPSPAAPDAPILLETAREGSVVAFDGARAYWFDGVPADAPRDLDALRTLATSSRSVAWSELVELRVVARGDGRALQAKHRNADSWSVPLDSSHVEPVQKALDVVDVRLGRELGRRTVLDMRLVATLMITAILWTGQLGVLVLPAVVAVFRPTTIMLAGLGSMAVVSGILEQLDDWSSGGELSIRYAALMLLGAAALWIAWSRARRDDKRDGLRTASITFGGMAALMLVVVALTAADTPIRAFIQRPALRTLSLSFLGMATVLLFVRTRAAKLGSAAAIALAVLTLVPSIAALDVFRSDRFTRETAAATEVARVTLEGNAMALELSPKGDRFLVRGYGNDSVDDEEEDDPRAGRAHYTVGSFDGAKRRVEALQAALVDDAHILVLRRVDRALELRLEGDDSAAVWTVRLPIVRRPVLTVSPPSQRWTVLSNDPAADSMIVVSGALTGGEPVIRRFASGRRARSEEDMYDMGQVFSVGDRIVNPTFEYKKSVSGMTALLARSMPRVALWEQTSSGEQKIGELDGMPQCGATDDGQVLCVVMQQLGRGQLWALDETGPARPLGSVPIGDMGRVTVGPGARVSSIRRSGAAVVAADINARKAWTIKLPSDSGFALEARTVPGRVVVLRLDSGKATVLAYRVDGL